MALQSDGLPLLGYASMVWRRRVLVLIIALGTAVPAFAVSASQTPQYEATGQILLTQRQLDDNASVRDTVLSDTQVKSQAATLTGPEVAERARALGTTSPIQAIASAGSNVVALSARDPDPRQAAATVEEYVRAFSEYRTQQVRKTLDSGAAQLQSRIASLQQQIDRLQQQINLLAPADRASLATQQGTVQAQQVTVQAQLGKVQIQQGLVSSGIEVVLDPAVPRSPISPTPVRDAMLALVFGLVLGISLAVLLGTLRLRSAIEPVVSQSGTFQDASTPVRHDTRIMAPGNSGRAPTPQPRQ